MVGALVAGAVFAVGTAFAFAAGAVLAFAAGAAVLAFASTEGAVLEFASAVFALVLAFELAEVGSPGLLDKTEILPLSAGIARNSADSMNVVAATMVTLDKTVAVPRGLNAELETLLVKSAPASVLPGCNNTAATSTRHERKNIPYNK